MKIFAILVTAIGAMCIIFKSSDRNGDDLETTLTRVGGVVGDIGPDMATRNLSGFLG